MNHVGLVVKLERRVGTREILEKVMISFGLGKDGETPEKASMCLDIATFSLVSYTRPFMCPASLCEPYAFPPSFWYSSIILSILCCSHFSSFPQLYMLAPRTSQQLFLSIHGESSPIRRRVVSACSQTSLQLLNLLAGRDSTAGRHSFDESLARS